MLNLSDIIVYIWLLPVVALIVFPLGMLSVWLVGKPLWDLSFKRAGTVSHVGSLSSRAAK